MEMDGGRKGGGEGAQRGGGKIHTMGRDRYRKKEMNSGREGNCQRQQWIYSELRQYRLFI